MLTTLLMFGEEGTLSFANLLHRIAAEEDRVIANTIYGTVFGTLCDRTDLLQLTALPETIVSSIQNGQLDNYEWAHNRDVIGVLAALNVEPAMIFELGNTHSAHYREDRTRRALDYVTRFQYCSEREE
ncbi:hypothetical protein V8J82_23245 [Gymnodinialimonas sp. 2305UL16-5]|uniref:hypothetical protein n=1 Tax=Gymnodinialimonas mytili TaxID=3126503 RepID=UPI00309E78BA